jgi:hypothetical protein
MAEMVWRGGKLMYDELVEDLRRMANTWLAEEYKVCAEAVRFQVREAADAIEELNSQLDDFKRLCLPLKENRLYKYSDGSFVEVFLILPSEPPTAEESE